MSWLPSTQKATSSLHQYNKLGAVDDVTSSTWCHCHSREPFSLCPPRPRKKRQEKKRAKSDRLRARKSVNHSTCEHVTALVPRTIAQCASTCRYLARGHHAATERFTANTCKAVSANGRQHQGTEQRPRTPQLQLTGHQQADA